MARKKHRTRKQQAALRKAQRAFRRKYGCKNGYRSNRKGCRKAYRTPRQIAAAKRNLVKARAARRAKKRRYGGKKKSKRRAPGYYARRAKEAAGIGREPLLLGPASGSESGVVDAEFV